MMSMIESRLERSTVPNRRALTSTRVAVVFRVPHLDIVISRLRDRVAQERVGEIEIVIGRELPSLCVEERQNGIGMLLEIVNFVLQTSAQHLEGEGLPGLGVKLEVI